MIFRNPTAADLPCIVDIYNATIPSRMVTADLAPVTLESKRAWFEKHNADRRPIWIMEVAGETIGWISLTDFHERPAYGGTSEVSIYLATSFQNKGFGKEGLQYALDNCSRLGIKTLVGLIFDHNRPSLQLFKQFGFTQWGLLPNVAELDGIERGVVIVGKRIES